MYSVTICTSPPAIGTHAVRDGTPAGVHAIYQKTLQLARILGEYPNLLADSSQTICNTNLFTSTNFKFTQIVLKVC